MIMELQNDWDLKKLLAFLKVQGKGEFDFPIELAANILEWLKRYARENSVSIEVFDPSEKRIVAFCAAGAVAGAGMGYLIAAVPGAVLGSIAGAAIGYQAAHIKITLDLNGDRGRLRLV